MPDETPTPDSPTHDLPRIDLARFIELLESKDSPAVPEAREVYDVLVAEGVEPAFALAQFRVESQYGTSGWAQETGSWGNMLFSVNLTTHLSGRVVKTDSAGHKYDFATYDSYVNAITDYCRYIHWYRDQYNLTTIYSATGRWLGLSRTGDSGHLSYVNTIVNDIIEYQFPPGDFYETGDKMIWAGEYIDRATGKLKKRLFVATGTLLYRGTNGDILKKLSPAAGLPGLNLFFLGPVNDSWEWGACIVSTTAADPLGTVVYVRNPDKTKVTTA